jgi:hypothetical protein
MARTSLSLWIEGSIATGILVFFLMVACPIAASGTPASTEDGATPTRSIAENHLLGTYSAHQVGLFFPPSGSWYIVPYSTNRDAMGGPAEDIAVPNLLQIRGVATPSVEVFRSPVDRLFELTPARTSAKPLRFEF